MFDEPNPKEAARRDEFVKRGQERLHDLLRALENKDGEVVEEAANILAMLGSEARPALPQLRRCAEQAKGMEVCALLSALVHILPEDEPVGPLMIACLESLPDGTFEKPEKYWMISLRDLSDSEGVEHFHRSVAFATTALMLVLAPAGRTRVEVPSLLWAASPKYPVAVRALALSVLAEFEEDATSALPGLQTLLMDENPLIRLYVGNAILCIKNDRAMLPELIKAMALDPELEKQFRDGAEKSFETLQEQKAEMKESWRNPEVANGWIQSMLRGLKHGRGYQKRCAIKYLRSMGSAAWPAVPALVVALNDRDDETRTRAAGAIAHIAIETLKARIRRNP